MNEKVNVRCVRQNAICELVPLAGLGNLTFWLWQFVFLLQEASCSSSLPSCMFFIFLDSEIPFHGDGFSPPPQPIICVSWN